VQIKYSILIPTRNGINYLPYAIESVLKQKNKNFELIVSDNYSKDGTWDYLQTLNDPRLIVTKPANELSMPAHYEYILSQSSGEWITILGDDDAVMPSYFDELDKLNFNQLNIEAIATRRAYYFWPGCEDIYDDCVVYYQARSVKKKKSSKLNLFLSLCSISLYTDMPQLYTTGIVHRKLVDKIKDKSRGNFFFGTSPDVYSAAVLALTSNKYLRVEKPLFWVGTSPKSIGLSGRRKTRSELTTEFWEQCRNEGYSVNQNIPKSLFDRREGALFLYDAVLNSPLANNFWKSNLVKHIVYGGLIAKDYRMKRIIIREKEIVLNRLLLDISWLTLAVIRMLNLAITKYKSALELIFSLRYRSSDRHKFSDITKASNAINMITK